ncbi:MAG: hypothetical protein HRU40_22105, partial [Saprospiraceae bacterium]|nr:hypothetical protein [Saprospiraceae bacterium]
MQKLFTLLIGLSFVFPTYAQVSQVTLTFSPVAGGNDVVVQASDQGNGLSPQGEITLIESTEYTLAINLGDDQATFQGRSEEIQFFFSPSADIFSGSINYADQDNNSLPIGFASEWITTCLDETSMGNFVLQLQDLGNGKSNSSTANDGANVFNLTWPITVNSDPAAPACENEEEIITDVVLTFTPMDGG